MEITGTENVTAMTSAINGLMHQTQQMFVGDWAGGDAAAAAQMVANRYASNPRVQISVGLQRTGHNRVALRIRVSAPTHAQVTRIEQEIGEAVRKSVDASVDEMRRTQFARAKAML